MNNILHIILIFLFSLFMISCGDDNEEHTNNTSSSSTISSTTTTSVKYVSVGSSGRILTSSNGTSWDNRSSGTTSNLIGVTYGNSKFLTFSGSMDSDTAATILTSSDGTTWTSTSVTCSSCADNTSSISLNDVTYAE